MSVLIKNRSNRFISVPLQNNGAECLTFKDVNKLGCLNGYIRGVVYQVFPAFEHRIYGKLLKMILIDKSDDMDTDSDDDDYDEEEMKYQKLPFFTRGKVAELCSTIKTGDVIVLEKPFVERLDKRNPVYHLSGDKNLSDISMWILKATRPSLIVKREKAERIEEVDESPEAVEDESNDIADSSVSSDSQGEEDLSDKERPIAKNKVLQSPQNRQTPKKRVENESDFVPVRVTRSASLPTSTTSNESKVTRSTKVHKSKLKMESSSRITRSAVAREPTTSESTSDTEYTQDTKETNKKLKGYRESPSKMSRITRRTENKELLTSSGPELSNKSRKMALRSKSKSSENSTLSKSKLQEPPGNKNTTRSNHCKDSAAKELSNMKNQSSQSEFEITEFASSQELSDKDQPVIKKGKRTQGVSSIPQENSKLLNAVVQIENVKLKPSPVPVASRVLRSNAQTSDIETFDDETTDEVRYDTRRKRTNSSKQRKSTLSSHRILRSHLQSSDSSDDEMVFQSQRKRKRRQSAKASCSGKQSLSHTQPQNTVSSSGEESSENNKPGTPSGIFSPGRIRSGKDDKDTSSKSISPRKSSRLDAKLKKKTASDNLPHHTCSPGKQTQSFRAACSDIEQSQESNNSSQPQTPSGLLKTNKLASRNNQETESPNSCPSPSNRACSDELAQDSPIDSQTGSQPTTSGVSFYTETTRQGTTSGVAVSSPSNAKKSPMTTTKNVPTTSNTLRDSYQVPSGYTKLSDLQFNTTASLFGVVKYFKPPWKSRGTDMCSVLVLADPSTDEPLECVIFNKNSDLLPQVRRIGDIVRLHRVNIKKYQDKFQGLSTRGFSCIVFDREVTIPVSPDAARFSTASFTFDNSDKDMVRTLKEWRISQDSLFEPAKVLTVSEVEPDLYFDIVCQVKGLSKQSNLDCVCLKATDGTDPKYEIKNCDDDDDGFEAQLPFDQTNFQFKTFDVYLYGDHAMLLLNMKVEDSCILMLHNVHASVVQGGLGASLLDVVEPTIELSVHRGSEYGRGLAVLSQDSTDAKELLQRLKTPS